MTQPITVRYLKELEDGLRGLGFRGRLLLMQSSAGISTARRVARVPIHLLESGPAAGVRAASALARRRGDREVICFDMGGTTAKACLIEEPQPLVDEFEVARVDRFKPGSGFAVRIPSVDLIEIGAGGGSIAAIDRLGLLRVGPESAGADPGPACYDRGGTLPTVTDANLLLGYLGADSFLGGRMKLNARAAGTAIERLAERLDLDPVTTAWGIHHLVNENMAAAANVHVIGRGRDPRRCVLQAFGGAGPAHGAAVARRLGVRQMIVPAGAGAASAFGLLVAPAVCEAAASRPALVGELDVRETRALLTELAGEVRMALADAGVDESEITFERRADMRLLGQVHEIDVPVDSLEPAQLEEAFVARYRNRFHVVPPAMPIQVLTWRVRGTGPSPNLAPRAAASNGVAGPIGERPVYFPARGFITTPVYARARLGIGSSFSGPAIVEEPEATTLVGPSDRVSLDTGGNLVLEVGSVDAADV